jgi:hypothetical protein
MKSFLIFLFLLGCQIQEFPVDIYVDSNFNNHEVKMINNAFEEWLIATDGFTQYNLIYKLDLQECSSESIDSNKSNVILKCSIYSEFYTESYPEQNISGQANTNRIIIYYDRIKEDKFYYKILLHEIGHFYSLNHDNAGIMKQGPLPPPCLDSVTLEQFCGIYDCSLYDIKSTCNIKLDRY